MNERRPLRTREWAVFIRLARWLAARRISPNAISILGMFMGIGAGVAFAATSFNDGAAQRLCFACAALLIPGRLLCNMLDGMVALEQGSSSRLGEIYNEAPDRVSDAVTLIGAGYAAGAAPWLGFTAAVGALLVAYVRAIGAAAGAGQQFCGPVAKPQRMLIMIIAAAYMTIAPASWTQPFGPGQWGAVGIALALVSIGCVVTIIRRLNRIAAALAD